MLGLYQLQLIFRTQFNGHGLLCRDESTVKSSLIRPILTVAHTIIPSYFPFHFPFSCPFDSPL